MSMLFDRWNVGALRAVVAAMPNTATILRNTATPTPGGWSQNYVVVGTTRCRIIGLPTPSEQVAGAQLAAISRWRLEVPNGTPIQMADRIQVDGPVAGRTFEVLGDVEKSWNVTDTYTLAEVRRL